MPDGLGMLDEQRKRRSAARNIPAPRNPPRRTPVQVVSLPARADEATPTVQKVPGDEQTPAPQTVADPVEEEVAPTRPPESKPAPVRRSMATQQPTPAELVAQTPEPAVQEPTIKMSIYLEHSDDLYLENITHAGKTGRHRIAISRSAVVRLALQRLADTMTTDQIVDELRKTGNEHQGNGRKRR